MKVNLQCGVNSLEDYVNIDSRPPLLSKINPVHKYMVGLYGNLDPLFEDNSLEEVRYSPDLNSIDAKELCGIIGNWFKKLAGNGVLDVRFRDINKSVNYALNCNYNDQKISDILLGQNATDRCILSTKMIVDVLCSMGLNIVALEQNESTMELVARKYVK